MDYKIRKIKKTEYSLLSDFLYEAIFVPEGAVPPPKSILASPELQIYIDHFGEHKDDHCLIAEADERPAGAVWGRVMNDYGHLDDRTPSLAISLYPQYRGAGIGTALLSAMLSLLKESGYERASLSVQKTNYAFRMYRKAGFQIVAENSQEYIMAICLHSYKGGGYGD